ncbi:MAG TPA: tRNA epoxyqueuosine(34) reductase QueG [Kofleriaceae bacterium]|nr:tRNA epoxyqueuosine(34) reductase QueG [Kofleriaceae bacterium]
MNVIEAAKQLGFARAAVVPIEPPRRHELYASWLAAGLHGEMAYLADPSHISPRNDLRALLATARSLVVVALAYERADPINRGTPSAGGGLVGLRGKIARYARGEDYHLVVRDKLVALADRIARELGRPVASRPCVDSAPVLEREWAERGGLGFVAKNTMLIAPGLGSYVVLGELLVDVELAITAPPGVTDLPKPRCGSCRACLDACPTRAFSDAYVLDARRCISYLTIEHQGPIPRELRAAIGTWVFGCDVCQEVCPFNAGPGEPADPALQPRSPEHALPDLVALAARGANQLRQFVKRTALRRVSRESLLRNVAVALGNTGSREAVPALAALLEHASPIVRGHAAWALGELGALELLAAHDDDDPTVRDEVSAARETAATRRS